MLAEYHLQKFALLSFGPAGSAVVGLALVLLISWNFPPEILGAIAILELIAVISTMVLTFGFDQAYVREFAEEANKTNLFNAALRVPTVALFCAMTCVFVTLIITDISFQSNLSDTIVAIFALYAATAVAIRMFSIVIRMKERLYIFAMLQLVQRASALVLIAALLNVAQLRSLTSVIACYLAGAMISLILHVLVLKGEICAAINLPLDKNLVSRLAQFGVPAGISAIAYAFLAASDRITLAFWGSMTDLGIYIAAQSMAAALALFTSVISLIWAPFVYKSELNGLQPAEYAPYVDGAIFTSYVAAGLICSLSWVLPLIFPSDYSQLPHFVPACMALPLFYVVAEVFGVGIGVARRMNIALATSVISAITALAIGTALVPLLGATGAAIAILVGALLFLVLRAEMAALLWHRLPSQKMYLTTFMFTIGAVLSLIKDDRLFWFIQFYWVIYFVIIAFAFAPSLHLIWAMIRGSLAK